MAVTLGPTANQPSVWFEGDIDPQKVPERYRLGDAFVPKGRYLDHGFLELELERVFTRTWLMACRLEELPGVGSYVEHSVVDSSVLVVRESPDSIRTYDNACPRGGARLAEGRGRVDSLTCPCHGQRWNLDGSIRPGRDDAGPRSDADLGLTDVRTERWGGFVFFNRDPNAQPLLEYLEPIPTIFEPFQYENMRITWWKSVIVPCNWKTVLDGFLEAYHVPATHPQLFRMDKHNTNIQSMKELDQRFYSPTRVYERTANYASVGKKFDPETGERRLLKDPFRPTPRDRDDERRGIITAVEYYIHELRAQHAAPAIRAAEALKTADIPEGVQPRRFYDDLVREYALADGLDWRRITAEQWAAAGTAWHLFPNTILLPTQGNAIGYRARPNGHDPDSCIYEAFAVEQIPVADYDKEWDVQPEVLDDWDEEHWGQILHQDLENAEDVTVGMHSPSFDGHRLSTEQEMTIFNHHRVADRYLWDD